MSREGNGLELSVVNPAGIFGPILGPDSASSVDLIKRLMNGMPGAPLIYFGVVDVQDVADLRLRAMTRPAAKGERFIAVSGNAISMVDIARILRARLGDLGQTSAPSSLAGLGCEARRKARCVSATGSAAARRDQKCDEREGETCPRLVTALERGSDCGHSREPHQVWTGEVLAFVNDFERIAVRVKYIDGIISRIVFQSCRRRNIVLGTGGHRRLVELIELSVILGHEAPVDGSRAGLPCFSQKKALFPSPNPHRSGLRFSPLYGRKNLMLSGFSAAS